LNQAGFGYISANRRPMLILSPCPLSRKQTPTLHLALSFAVSINTPWQNKQPVRCTVQYSTPDWSPVFRFSGPRYSPERICPCKPHLKFYCPDSTPRVRETVRANSLTLAIRYRVGTSVAETANFPFFSEAKAGKRAKYVALVCSGII